MKLRFVRSVHTKATQPKTSSGCSPSSGYNLTACRQGNAEASKNLLNVNNPSDPLDRGWRRGAAPSPRCRAKRIKIAPVGRLRFGGSTSASTAGVLACQRNNAPKNISLSTRKPFRVADEVRQTKKREFPPA